MSDEPAENKIIIEKLDIIQKILDVSEIDTGFRDIYTQHVKTLLSSDNILTIDEYHEMIGERERLSRLPKKINASIEREDWESVKELSKSMKVLHNWVEQKQPLYEIGQAVYDDVSIHINPFSPGLYHVAGIKLDELPLIRREIIKELNDIILSDLSIKDFCRSRKKYFDSINLEDTNEKDKLFDETDLSDQIKEALEHGDIDRVEELSEKLIKLQNSTVNTDENKKNTGEENSISKNRFFEFSEETLSRAKDIGLVHKHTKESPSYALLYRHALHPEFDNDKKTAWEKIQYKDKYFKDGIPEALKTHIEIYARHILINSCGIRYLPDFANEDILVEDFSETDNFGDIKGSPLLGLLGFEKRNNLSRLKIEHALSLHSHRIIKDELDLDPILFKLVCIPSDIYLRIGESMGWGRQKLWTHFDEYEILRNGRFDALAGGDTRFGGIYDLVSIGREYESDHVIARFAVVMRDRMLKMI